MGERREGVEDPAVVDLAEHYASRRRAPQEPEPNADALSREEIEKRWDQARDECGLGAARRTERALR